MGESKNFLLCRPLAGDIRPYFTMQDSDSAQFVNKLSPKAGLILGVTYPFFESSCVHWPTFEHGLNVVRLRYICSR